MISTGRSRWRTALEVVGVVVAISALTLAAPDFGYESRYRLEDVGVGEQGRLREYDVTVTSVRLTRSIEKYSDVLTTNDAFVVLTVQAVVRTDAQNLNNSELRTSDGHRYDPKPDWVSAAPSITQPGFTAVGMQVYEVPVERLRGAVVIIGPDGGEVTTYDAAVRVDLGLSGEESLEEGPLSLPPATTQVSQ